MVFDDTGPAESETQNRSPGGAVKKLIPSVALGAGVIALVILLMLAF